MANGWGSTVLEKLPYRKAVNAIARTGKVAAK